MTLADLLQPLQTRTLAAARAYLSETVTIPNTDRIDTTAIMARLSLADAGAVFATLTVSAPQNPLVAEALLQLRGNGLDLSHANAQAMIDALFTPELAAKVKALGQKQVTRAEASGFGRVKDGHILEVL